ncbi:hypothetical protein M431DRAFT_553398 [Trichoderma harzianum CBS 226.95]|uniref:Uncharacterized protein n=1 Tax=Trichoderma harzianum CBS 226.95 TaxID=983964 RepID=A0A2T4ABJ2_TRIHA|nr:hypothetical protein M431DRAFT_553398 [Trichoderma harzianum CBS 226.95]PTB54450.1 hypothetical protein M431DRAFT_553398 [Trichoderma harzianum CBS 226.95]
MKTPSTTLLFIVFAASVVRPEDISPRDMDAQKLCGDLEVMKMDVNQLPSGISLDNVRMCEEHPLTQDDIDILDGASLAPADLVITPPLMAVPGAIAGRPVMMTANGVGLLLRVDTVLGQHAKLLKTAA